MGNVKKFGDLEIGTVINFFRPTTADDTDYVVLKHKDTRFGAFTELLDKKSNDIKPYSQHTEIKGCWSIVKEPKVKI